MDAEALIRQAKRLLENIRNVESQTTMAEALELFRNFVGSNSSFYKLLEQTSRTINPNLAVYREAVENTLKAFINHLENGLFQGISIERKAQIDVVSDFLEQATQLLDDPKVHSAAPAVIIGAALEEFLRNWIEAEKMNIQGKKLCIDTYATALREKELITKQDMKDITSWAGLRNHASHGEWEIVKNREQISLMLQGVNLFMRKYMKE